MNLAQVIGELMLAADRTKPDPKPKRVTLKQQVERVMKRGERMTLAELRDAVGPTNRASFCVGVNYLCHIGFLVKEGKKHSYQYRRNS